MKKNDKLSDAIKKNVKAEEVVLEYSSNTDSSGFIRLYDCLVNYTDLSLMDRLVYCALNNYCEYANNMGIKSSSLYSRTTNVTNKTLANRLGIGKTSVSTSIAKLQSLGIIAITKNTKNNTRYIRVQRDFSKKQAEEEFYGEEVKKGKVPQDDKLIFFADELEDESESKVGGKSEVEKNPPVPTKEQVPGQSKGALESKTAITPTKTVPTAPAKATEKPSGSPSPVPATQDTTHAEVQNKYKTMYQSLVAYYKDYPYKGKSEDEVRPILYEKVKYNSTEQSTLDIRTEEVQKRIAECESLYQKSNFPEPIREKIQQISNDFSVYVSAGVRVLSDIAMEDIDPDDDYPF